MQTISIKFDFCNLGYNEKYERKVLEDFLYNDRIETIDYLIGHNISKAKYILEDLYGSYFDELELKDHYTQIFTYLDFELMSKLTYMETGINFIKEEYLKGNQINGIDFKEKI